MRTYSKYEAGQKFGKLTLVERLPGGQKWRCVCECGTEVITQISGGSRACYSCAHQNTNLKHGHNRMTNGPDRIYRIWVGMKSRCQNSNDTGYRYYGGKGVKVCEEWQTFEPFYEWAMTNGYRENLTIDRIDVYGDYCPENCRWITMAEQANNKRKNKINNYGKENKNELS